MADLDRLIRYEPDPESHYDIGVLSRAPIVHAQFEAIHPFVDGNGRVGRLLFPLMFVCDGGHPLHLATFLKGRQQEYYDALLEVQMKLELEKHDEPAPVAPFLTAKEVASLCNELASACGKLYRPAHCSNRLRTWHVFARS